MKKISKVSIYRLRPVYTFLYTVVNGNVRASFVQKKKKIEILWSKKTVCMYLRNRQNTSPPPPLHAIVRIWLDYPLPLCAHVLYG